MAPDQNFEDNYFRDTYRGKYYKRNPIYKWEMLIREISNYRNSGHLLDVGCASGIFLQQAIRLYNCDGCDVSNYAIDLARKGLPNNVRLFVGSLDQIEGREIYDIITCFDVIEHIEDLNNLWNNLLRLSKPDGIVAITVPVYDGPLGWLVNILDKDDTHIHRRERNFWLDQVQTHFCLLSYIGIWRYFFLQHYYFHVLSRITRAWSPAILLIGEKYK